MAVTTLVLAIIGCATGVTGAVTGIFALRWQVTSWRREGPLVRLIASQSALSACIEIIAVNAGRGPVTVNRLVVPLRDGKAMPIMEGVKGFVLTEDHLPHRLEAGTSATWDIDSRMIIGHLKGVRAELIEKDKPTRIRAILGSGDYVEVDISALLRQYRLPS